MYEPAVYRKTTLALQALSIAVIGSAFFGFLVVNIYLATYGFWDFNFLKVEYVSAGVEFLLFTLFPAILSYAFFEAENVLERYRKEKSRLISVLAYLAKFPLFVFLGILSVFVFDFAVMLGGVFLAPTFLYVLSIGWSLLIFGAVWVIRKYRNEIDNLRNKRLALNSMLEYFFAHYRFLYILFAIPFLVFVFSLIIYPATPRYIGGGEPSPVMVGLVSTFDAKSIGLTNRFYAQLIYQSTDSLLVKTISGIYLLKQNDVTYIQYLGNSDRLGVFNYVVGSSAATSTPK